MIEFDFFDSYRLVTNGTDLVLPFEDAELRDTWDGPADIPQFSCFRKRFSDVETGAIMSKNTTRPLIPDLAKRKLFN